MMFKTFIALALLGSLVQNAAAAATADAGSDFALRAKCDTW